MLDAAQFCHPSYLMACFIWGMATDIYMSYIYGISSYGIRFTPEDAQVIALAIEAANQKAIAAGQIPELPPLAKDTLSAYQELIQERALKAQGIKEATPYRYKFFWEKQWWELDEIQAYLDTIYNTVKCFHFKHPQGLVLFLMTSGNVYIQTTYIYYAIFFKYELYLIFVITGAIYNTYRGLVVDLAFLVKAILDAIMDRPSK